MANAIKISKPGVDISEASDKDLLFNSDYPFLKIHKQGSSKITTDASGQAVYTIYHDVGKIPMYFVRGEVMTNGFTKTSFFRRYPQSSFFGAGTYGFHIVKPYADRIEIRWDLPGVVGQVLKFDYIICEDPVILNDTIKDANKKLPLLPKNSYVPKDYRLVTKPAKVGIYVSKEGKNVSSLNDSDFVFKMDGASISIKERLSLQTTQLVSDSPIPFVFNTPIVATAMYKHGYGYIPEIIAFVTTQPTRQGVFGFDPGNTYTNVAGSWTSGDDVIGGIHTEAFDCYADEENLYVTAVRTTTVSGVGLYNVSANYTFDILLLMEEAK